MRITKIEQQKKDKGRYNIYIGGEYSFGLYDNTILKYALRSGDELEEEKWKEIREFDEFNYGKKAAYRFLSYRQRSSKEIEKKLKSKKLSDASIEKVISWLKELKYIDDEQFAKSFVEDKLRKKPLGIRSLRHRLNSDGIDKETAEKILAENYSSERQFEKAGELLAKYVKHKKFKTDNERKSKCYKYLISRGFEGDIIQQVLNKESF